ncbi:MAG: NAD(+)/NADH kinase [Candidatus Bathyarchaeota archaeon]|nr:MAG: NAD(+)/NADH kinase [Candidatus Bathyarchaeota archaeon]
MFNAVSIIARVDQRKALDFATNLIEHLEARGLAVSLEPRLAKHAKRKESAITLKEMKTDLIITVGGDGTILRTCLLLPKPEPPILAINMGVRGFLAEVPPEKGLDAVNRCLNGNFHLEKCMKLSSSIEAKRLPDALNEVLITSQAPSKLLHVRIRKDETAVAECRADGMLVASQVGSTGYSLSAGGPVLDPDVDAFVFTPICPLTAFHPLVFSAKNTILIQLLKPKKAFVVLDGHYRAEMNPKNPRISVSKSEHESSFVRFDDGFYRRLKSRLLFARS